MRPLVRKEAPFVEIVGSGVFPEAEGLRVGQKEAKDEARVLDGADWSRCKLRSDDAELHESSRSLGSQAASVSIKTLQQLTERPPGPGPLAQWANSDYSPTSEAAFGSASSPLAWISASPKSLPKSLLASSGSSSPTRFKSMPLKAQSYSPETETAASPDAASLGWPSRRMSELSPGPLLATSASQDTVRQVLCVTVRSGGARQLRPVSSQGLDATFATAATPTPTAATQHRAELAELPFVPCRTELCAREATLWSPVEKRPYCVACWNAGKHHLAVHARLRSARGSSRGSSAPTSGDHSEDFFAQSVSSASPASPASQMRSSPSTPPEQPLPPSPTRLYLGRSYISDGSFASYADKARATRLKFHTSGSALRASATTRPRASAHVAAAARCKTLPSQPLYSAPLKILGLGGCEPPFKPPEFSFAATGYSKQIELPLHVAPPPAKTMQRIGRQTVFINCTAPSQESR